MDRGVSALGCVASCFPPGSMTGAPKQRTVQLLEGLERGVPRGVYSGTLGYFSLDGSADLAVVIRTICVGGGDGATAQRKVSVGAGGAITMGSDPGGEYDEMLLKARAPATRASVPRSLSQCCQLARNPTRQ